MVAIKNATRALCTTPACLQLASDFVKNLAPNYKDIDPCTDFEEMVCGGWRARHEIPATRTSIDTIGVMDEASAGVLREIIEGPYPGDSGNSADRESFERMKLAYDTCMDEDGLEELGVTPLTKRLNDLQGAFGGSDWSQPLLFTSLFNAASLISMYVATDFEDPDVQLVYIDTWSVLSLPSKDVYTNTTMLMGQYVPVVAEILQGVRGGNAASNFTEQARELVKFEAELAAISPPRSASFYELATKASFSDADALAPQLGLPKVYSALAPPHVPPGDLLWNMAYIGNLSLLLDKTPRSVIESYFTWRLILGARDLVLARPTDIFQPFTTLYNQLQGITTNPSPQPRWRTCLSSVRSNLGWILSRFFVQRFFTPHDYTLSNTIISDIRTAYIRKFTTLTWLDEPTRAKAIEKINLMTQKIGYPTSNPNLTDPDSLLTYYHPVSITSSHFNNTLSAQSAALRRNFQLLAKPTDRTLWGDFFSVIVNAYYAAETNEIAFPAGILQPPLFHGDFPSAANYGAFGAVAGHEVSHGFDENGKNFDGTGRLVSWWSEGVEWEFKKREECFVSQYGNMTVYANDGNGKGMGYKVDGVLTLGENEADSAGLVAAYEAWLIRRRLDEGQEKEEEEEEEEEEEALPGLEEWTRDPEIGTVPVKGYHAANPICTRSGEGEAAFNLAGAAIGNDDNAVEEEEDMSYIFAEAIVSWAETREAKAKSGPPPC
ncbi:hypothetical protein B0T14DRAFT_599069 [Immersiella caudata]|uniref:Uncharacterized protein n=1 Tax=Immersiella caudata TaxID=314043 RepID=A0AA40CCM2_9PEZI|nr:hypothetical protein B0T14DRAFT_599069 [Immersiella caudata]